MPISTLDGCSAEHWNDVKAIIVEAIEEIVDPKFDVRLVSDADDIGVIQKRIVQNVYSSDVIICDVSGKNPNVMFELGMRLAFDKPTVIIKDDKTDYSFDTGIIEHVPYPRDLRFTKMVGFKALLAEKVIGTHNAAKTDPNHSTFLKNFGKFHVASISQDVVPADKLVVEMLTDLQAEVSRLRQTLPRDLGKRRNEGKLSEAIARIASQVTKYTSENPKTDLLDLLGSRDFQHEMERKCDAPRYFNSPIEFGEALERTIKDLVVERSRNT